MAMAAWHAGLRQGDGVEPSRARLEEYGDMALRCCDGVDVPASRYVCVSLCEVLRNVWEDTAIASSDADHQSRAVVPLPGIPSRDIWAAVDVLHGVRAPGELDAQEVTVALRGLELLGASDAVVGSLAARLWSLTKHAALETMLERANMLLRDTRTREACLARLVELVPLWRDFETKVLGALDCRDAKFASFALGKLGKFFPAGLVASWAIEACCRGGGRWTAAECATLLSRHGTLFHPAEVPDVLARLARATSTATDPVTALARWTSDAVTSYDALPLCASKTHGSLLSFHDTPTVSALVIVEPGPAGRCPKRVAPWLVLDLDAHAGTLDARFGLWHLLDADRRRHDEHTDVQVRVTCFTGDGLNMALASETWYEFVGVPTRRGAAFALGDAQTSFGGEDASLQQRAALSNREVLRRVRVDVFFDAEHSVLHCPF